jgi:hypothetical protein
MPRNFQGNSWQAVLVSERKLLHEYTNTGNVDRTLITAFSCRLNEHGIRPGWSRRRWRFRRWWHVTSVRRILWRWQRSIIGGILWRCAAFGWQFTLAESAHGWNCSPGHFRAADGVGRRVRIASFPSTKNTPQFGDRFRTCWRCWNQFKASDTASHSARHRSCTGISSINLPRNSTWCRYWK